MNTVTVNKPGNPRASALQLALVFLSALLLAAGCAQAPEDDTTTNPAAAAANMDDHEAHSALPLPKRLAFMSGHVEAGLALYRAGEPAMAAPHLQHPVSETHASERVGLDALGFDADVFLDVSKALESGVPAAQIEPRLRAAENNLSTLSERAGGDTKDVIHFLLDTVVEEYSIGVRNGTVTDPGEYQDAFGFTVVALKRAEQLGIPKRQLVHAKLNTLLGAWPKAPVPPQNPTPASKVESMVKDVRATLDAHHR